MTFTGRVITGAGRGKQLGYPTINLKLDDLPEGLDHGIYACFVDIEGVQYSAAAHYGPRLVFDGEDTFEVHILDTDVPTPPPELMVEIVKKVRDVQNFPDVEKLKKQIARDCIETRAILGVT